MNYSRIIGTGSHLPEKVLTNKDLEKMVDTSDEWIVERSGIRERRIAAPGESSCDLAEKAALNAIDAAGIRPDEIDLIVTATCTPEYVFPSNACLLQERLGVGVCAAFDVQAACAGFIYAMSTADNFIRAGAAKRALVIGSETMSRVIDWNDRGTCVLFADGAGALILEQSEAPGVYSTHVNADGRCKDLLYVPGWVSDDYTVAPEVPPYMQMRGNEVFKTAVNTLGKLVEETLAENQLTKADVDWLVPHQANIRIINAIARRLNMPMEQVVATIEKHGNTSAASVPLALDCAIRDGRIKKGDLLLLEAFGGGFTWGSALVKY